MPRFTGARTSPSARSRLSRSAFRSGSPLTFLFTLGLDGLDLIPEDFSQEGHPFTDFISNPDEFSFIVAFLAGMAGVLSLTSAKSGALVGVLISVTTIPAAANIGVAAALGDGEEWLGAMEQLALNMGAIFLACIGTLYLQRLLYHAPPPRAPAPRGARACRAAARAQQALRRRDTPAYPGGD